VSIILHSALTPVAAADALRRSIDQEKKTLFSLSGYKGSLPVLGEVTETTFHLQKRRYWRNDFAPHLYGQFRAEPGGSLIEVHFDTSRWVRTFMRIWLICVALFGSPMFVLTALDLFTGSHHTAGDTWVGIIVFPAMIAWGFLLPKIGRLIGRGDERFLLDFVQQTLAARIEENVLRPTWSLLSS
jgi:hypothetical protein